MKVLYLDCFSGISGDMFLSALLDAGLKLALLKKELSRLNLKNQFSIQTSRVKQNGISAIQLRVKEKPKERSLDEIINIINKSRFSSDIKNKAIRMFQNLQKAEKKIHKEFHHFHELGRLDTIIDVLGAIIGLKLLRIEKVFASKINVGSGFVNTQHGKMVVPAPATLELLKGMPIYLKGESELVTPTGALLLSEFVSDFTMPVIRVQKIGYGAGHRKTNDFPNLLRVLIGETDKRPSHKIIMETNIDDMNPELYEYVMEELFKSGALDVYMTPIYMKKNRPGIILSCICNESEKEKIARIILKETTSIGLRIFYADRLEMTREKKTVKTKYGLVQIKISRYGDIVNISPEYESCKRLAKARKKPLKEIYLAAQKAGLSSFS